MAGERRVDGGRVTGRGTGGGGRGNGPQVKGRKGGGGLLWSTIGRGDKVLDKWEYPMQDASVYANLKIIFLF